MVNRLLKQAIDEENTEFIKQMWLSIYPHMTKDNFISFEEFKIKVYNASEVQNSTESTENILNEMYEIRKKFTVKEGD